MELVVHATVEALAAAAAARVCDLLRQRPTAHLCLAAGGSPRPLYAALVARAAAGEVSFAEARVTKLDEWLGVPLTSPASCDDDLRRHFLGPLAIREEQYLAFDSLAADPAAEAARVTRELDRRGPLDLAILGLGLNGHLGMNEPADELPPRVHVATLAAASRQHALLQALAEPPTHGLTLGLADLLGGARVWLLVTGASKREALHRTVHGPLTTHWPASLLQLHPHCTVFADAAAADGLA